MFVVFFRALGAGGRALISCACVGLLTESTRPSSLHARACALLQAQQQLNPQTHALLLEMHAAFTGEVRCNTLVPSNRRHPPPLHHTRQLLRMMLDCSQLIFATRRRDKTAHLTNRSVGTRPGETVVNLGVKVLGSEAVNARTLTARNTSQRRRMCIALGPQRCGKLLGV